jgi:hypothetical protein
MDDIQAMRAEDRHLRGKTRSHLQDYLGDLKDGYTLELTAYAQDVLDGLDEQNRKLLERKLNWIAAYPHTRVGVGAAPNDRQLTYAILSLGTGREYRLYILFRRDVEHRTVTVEAIGTQRAVRHLLASSLNAESLEHPGFWHSQ